MAMPFHRKDSCPTWKQLAWLGLSIITLSLHARSIPSLPDVLNSERDLWGETALKQPAGPTYQFFANLLPPPRYVNADFRYYPIVLSAPGSAVKARLVSNGSAVNARGGSRSWHDIGFPVTFRVGPDELRFGDYFQRLEGPRYVEGYLPVVELHYHHGEAVYTEECFASVDPVLAQHGVVFVKFSLREGTIGNVAAQLDIPSKITVGKGMLQNENGQTLVWFDGRWKWTRQRLTAALKPGQSATLAIVTTPIDSSLLTPLSNDGYAQQRAKCIETWRNLLARGMQVEVPEPIVNHAWRSLIIGSFTLINGDRIHYSAGNQYDQLYEAEGSDAANSLLLWGYTNDVQQLIPPLLDFTRKGLEYHQAGHKLQLLADYYQLTHDNNFIRTQRPRWEKEVQRIVNGRTSPNGLFPRERYCGDVATPVFSLNSNAKCWRALRDFAQVLAESGDQTEANELLNTARQFRADILAAVAKSERRDVQPAFIPIALSGEEQPYTPITGTKMGSYWNLMANYVAATGVFGTNSFEENALIDYQRLHGGLCMGLIRSRPNPTFWTGPHNVNPLYGERHILTVLRRDEPERALVSFYGMLAQGMTRDTFIGAEGASLTPLDENGRLFYCPPNSASNGFFLSMLRHLLIQDWDLDDDGQPETLRLLFATPRSWLDDGQSIDVERAPTAFGDVSLHVESHLKQGEVVVTIQLPPRAPQQSLLRLRLPAPWHIITAQIGSETLPIDAHGAIDISSHKNHIIIRCKVAR